MSTNHARLALLFPDVYKGDVVCGNETRNIVLAATYMDLPPIIAWRGIWAICHDGLYCLCHTYFIAKERFDESDWAQHMQEKTWVDMLDFHWALDTAKELVALQYI